MLCKDSRSRTSRRQGFSLVELIVVMVILGMLAGLVAVSSRGYLITGRKSAATNQIAEFVKAVNTFQATQGRYPTTDEGLEVLLQPTSAFPDGFLPRVSKDPWKNPYEYISPGSSGPFEVVSLGADGREGGEGEDADISSDTLNEEDA